MSGKGERFLFLAGGQVGSQTCVAVQLKGAALGEPCALATCSATRLLPSRVPWEGPARVPPGWGATWRAPYGRAGSSGCVPEQRQLQPKRPASLMGGSSPSSAVFPPTRLASFLFRSPRPLRPSPSLAAGVSPLLAAARPLRHRLLATHSWRHRESGPAAGEGAAEKLETGRNRPHRAAAGPQPFPECCAWPRVPAGSHSAPI